MAVCSIQLQRLRSDADVRRAEYRGEGGPTEDPRRAPARTACPWSPPRSATPSRRSPACACTNSRSRRTVCAARWGRRREPGGCACRRRHAHLRRRSPHERKRHAGRAVPDDATKRSRIRDRLAHLFAIDFATSRAHSMKRPTTGVIVRFFCVKIATGHGRTGNSRGNIFIGNTSP